MKAAAAARMFAANGADVMVADRNADREADCVRHRRARCRGGPRHRAARRNRGCRGRDLASVWQARCDRQYGRLRSARTVRQEPPAEAAPHKFRRSFKVNMEVALRLAWTCLLLLKSSFRAAIVHTASLAGVHGCTQQMGQEWTRSAFAPTDRTKWPRETASEIPMQPVSRRKP